MPQPTVTTEAEPILTLVCYRISELRRDLQAVIITKANLHIGPAIENYGGETFLSQEVAINLMQEYKLAFKRCEMVGGELTCYFGSMQAPGL